MIERLWRKRRQLQLLALPRSRRVYVSLRQDGRFLPFLLTSLHELGLGIVLSNCPFAYRELRSLRHSVPIPFVFARDDHFPECDAAITDSGEQPVPADIGRHLSFDYHYFDPAIQGSRMPYFLHPSAYHSGAYAAATPAPDKPRRFRLGFFGTHDPAFYSQQFNFPTADRSSLVEALLNTFGPEAIRVEGPPERWPSAKIVYALDSRGGDRSDKAFLSPTDYRKALEQCDFVLSPPGWCMPLSHNLVEAMAAGAVPVTNCSRYLGENPADRRETFNFETVNEFIATVREILAMPPTEVMAARHAVQEFYQTRLRPGPWLAKQLEHSGSTTVLVNAEEASIFPPPSPNP